MITRFKIHAVVAFSSALLAIPGVIWWKDSILFVIGLSLFANFYAAVSALEASDDSDVTERLDELTKMVEALGGKLTPANETDERGPASLPVTRAP